MSVQTVTEVIQAGYWNPRRHPSTTEFRRPSDAEFEAAIAQVAGLLGEEYASRPSIQGRLVICRKTSEAMLLLSCPATWISAADPAFVCAPEPGPELDSWLAVEQRAFSIEAAVALLASSESPERELERRRAVLRQRDELRAQREDAAAKRETAAREAEERSRRFRTSEWGQLPLARRMAYSLALALEGSDPELAAAVWDVADQAEHLRCPTIQWWRPKGQRAE